MDTSRSGESPSRLPSSALPCTLIRSTWPCGVWATSAPATASTNNRTEFRWVIGEPPSQSLHLFDIPGHIDYRDALAAPDIQQRLEHGRALVVQEVVIPVPLHKFGNNHRQLTPGILLLQVQHILHERTADIAIRGLQNHQPGRWDAKLLNGSLDELFPLFL